MGLLILVIVVVGLMWFYGTDTDDYTPDTYYDDLDEWDNS